MPSIDDIEQITRNLVPARTVLFLGAGATVPSGAPTAVDLCRHLEKELANGERISDDLAELSSILQRRHSRRLVAEAVISRLSALQPDGALIALASYPWAAIYTTNYDQLIERAFQRAQKPCSVIRSNYDWDEAHVTGRVPLFKIHGCVSQDTSLGHRASMILTYEDYDACSEYRQLLYKRLDTEIAGGHIVVLGHSLQDPDIQELFRDAVKLQRTQGAPGKVHLVMYQIDPERADVWRARGVANVAKGDVNVFAHSIGKAQAPSPAPAKQAGSVALRPELQPCTVFIPDASGVTNPVRLFYGGTATYGDISAGLTFERDVERDLLASTAAIVTITGVAGTGKSTLARRLLAGAHERSGVLTYEHRPEFPLLDSAWCSFEKDLRESGQRALLLIDSCTQFQREVNRLCRNLPSDSHLRLVLTAETSAWKVRQKDPRVFSDAQPAILSQLSRPEIGRMLSVIRDRPSLANLVGAQFLSQSPKDQADTLAKRCDADMFVCLKALFSAESLDQIILKEYANLDTMSQDIYRLTCALQAAGALPHRQMILRLSGVEATAVSHILSVLEGMIEESEKQSALGIYSWRSRHDVVADLISRYKYSEPAELFDLFARVIETANPSYYEEARTLREMCGATRGIRAIPEREQRLTLFRRISYVMPGDRVARHRLVSELLQDERIADAEAELRRAIEDVKLDPPLQRYKVRLEVARSRLAGLLPEDRRAMLNQALNEAEVGIKRFPESKHIYMALADAAEAWNDLTNEHGKVTWAIGLIDQAYERLLDPDLAERRRRLERLV